MRCETRIFKTQPSFSSIMKNQITIKLYKESDSQALANIYYNTIHHINSKDYSKEQIEAWAPKSCLELEGWQKKWKKLPPIVARCNDIIVGFAEFENNGHIDCFYVHHECQGNGVGSALIGEIIKQAKIKNVSRIFSEVSITAKPFFEKMGFIVAKEQLVNIRGVELKNFVMEKI